MPEQMFMKLGMYIMASEPISTAYFINPSHQSLFLYVSPAVVAGQRVGENVTAAMNTHATTKNCWMRIFCAVRIISKESRRKVLPRTSCLYLCLPPFFYSSLCTCILKTKLRGFSPQANYTDRATAACRRS
jgi:hypothetical protein